MTMPKLRLKPSNSIIDSISSFGQSKITSRKILVLGDQSIGKTSLLHVYALNHFPQFFEPAVVDHHTVDVLVDDEIVELSLWDNVGEDELGYAGPSSYANTHVVMLCFSVDQPNSLVNAENKWLDRIIEKCPGVKICLLALRCDLRDDPKTHADLANRGQRPIDYEKGLAAARRVRASRYLECSARRNRGVSEAFLEVARVSISKSGRLRRTRSSPHACVIS